MVCKHDDPCTTLVVAIDPANMTAVVRIVQHSMWVFVSQAFLYFAAGKWPIAQAL